MHERDYLGCYSMSILQAISCMPVCKIAIGQLCIYSVVDCKAIFMAILGTGL